VLRRHCCWARLSPRLSPPSIDISRRYDTQQQTRRTPLLLLIDETDRQTGGQTLDRFIDPAPHTVGAVAKA